MKLAARLCLYGLFSAVMLLSSLCALLAFIPFTYQQVIRGGLFPWLSWFVKWNPILHGLESGTRSYCWSLLFLLPVLILAVVEGIGAMRGIRWEAAESGNPISASSWKSAALLAVVYGSVAIARQTPAPGAQGILAQAANSIASHAVAGSLLFLVFTAIEALSALTPRQSASQFVLTCLFLATAATFVFLKVVCPPISFAGAPAVLYACVIGSAVVLLCIAIGLRTGKEEPVTDGIATALRTFAIPAPPTIALPVLALLAVALAILTARQDWNYLMQKLSAAVVWLMAFSYFYCKSPRESKTRFLPQVAATILALGAYEIAPAMATSPAILESYAGFDASYRFLNDSWRSAGDSGFYTMLARSANIPRSIHLQPVDIPLATQPPASGGMRPNIFIFVIDSLRRDYILPYQPSVTFTPSIAEFARDSVVFRNAFTAYGGTGLAEPSIWVGGRLPHQQYPTPFSRMNSLEKLIQAQRYRSFISKDSILSVILKPETPDVELDRDRPTMRYDFCDSLTELQGKLSGDAPKFAYIQPQNIHISVIEREGATVPAGSSYPGFYAPYASRLQRIDACFGGFIDNLKRRGLYSNSVVILTADHGDSLGEEGRMGHAYTLYPEVVRIPLIVHLPDAWKSRVKYRTDDVAFSIDITPSLYYLLGYRGFTDNPIFGSPLFTDSETELDAHRRDSWLITSSYAAVYAVLRDKGRSLYIADAVNRREEWFSISDHPSRETVTSSFRKVDDESALRGYVEAINKFYHWSP